MTSVVLIVPIVLEQENRTAFKLKLSKYDINGSKINNYLKRNNLKLSLDLNFQFTQ